jgi:hypothetical protein
LPQIEHRTLVDLAIPEFEYVPAEIRRDVLKPLDDTLAAFGVNLHETLPHWGNAVVDKGLGTCTRTPGPTRWPPP